MASDLEGVWKAAWRGYHRLCIGDRVVVKFSPPGGFALGTVVPSDGVTGDDAQPGRLVRLGGDVTIRLDDGRLWWSPACDLQGHIRRVRAEGAER